jgi:alkanesulfonate monooxygenase SsuD/methylene tetrahydromethanopterin reductase-like flavin-dependent oxidoreductase (luciferase family)
VIRDTKRAATDAWAEIARHHGIVGRVAADGTERGLTIGGSPADVARYLAGYREAGTTAVIIVFRAPFDDETIERVGELREALAALG